MARTTIRTEDVTDSEVTTAKMATDPTNATNLASGTVGSARMGSGTASSTTVLYGDGTWKAEPVTDVTGINDDIALLGFKVAANGSLARYNLVDQSIDAFEDASGVDASASTNETRDSAGKYYSGSVAESATGGTITTYTDSGTNYKVHTFLASSAFVAPSASAAIDILVVGGGGSGATEGSRRGGGGGGGMAYGTGLSIDTGSRTVTIGPGGTSGGAGTASSMVLTGSVTATGNAGAGAGTGVPGGGGGGGTGIPLSATGGAGGNGSDGSGAGSAGSGGPANDYRTGVSQNYGGGGGGGHHHDDPQGAASGGAGGGGDGGGAGTPGAEAGTANTGGGGGGAGAAGGSGIVVVRYDDDTAFLSYDDMTLISNAQTAQSAPTSGDLVITYTDGAGTAVVNTDIKAYISRDGSAYTSAVTLASQGTTGGHTILTANGVDLSGITTGTAMRWKIETLNQSVSKSTRIHAVSLGWS